jgi:NAD(P)-dependent dehydrogenase (short-subunit alcohol dehydrogenase family)
MTVLNPDLLQGRAVALAGPVPEGVAAALAELGARVEVLGRSPGPGSHPEQAGVTGDETVGKWARGRGPLHALVYDAGPSFAQGGLEALVQMTQDAWQAVREVAVGALLEAQGPGKIVLLAPRPDAGPHAEAARSGLENLARTLSVEWARHEVTVVAVAPGPRTGEDELAELVCFLCSPAGAYLSGCRLETGRIGR